MSQKIKTQKKNNQPYFKNVKLYEIVYSLYYGKGQVVSLSKEEYYTFQVEYEYKKKISYTNEGIADWCIRKNSECKQTLFYEKDINLNKLDFQKIDKLLLLEQSHKKEKEMLIKRIKLIKNIFSLRKTHKHKKTNLLNMLCFACIFPIKQINKIVNKKTI